MKPSIEFLTIPQWLLYFPTMSLPEKVFLALVFSFKNKPDGLKLSNDEIGRIICLHPGNVSTMITRLAAAGWITITGKQSRWRKIYFSAGAKVEDSFTFAQHDFTLAQAQSYFSAGAKHNIKYKKDNSNFPLSPNTLPEKIEKLPQTPPDPEKLKHVMADLGFDTPSSDTEIKE